MKITQPAQPVTVALNAAASGVGVSDPGGVFGGNTNVQDVLDWIAAGGLGYLTRDDGGGGLVQAHGNLGATETIDTANGNYHWGTLNADCTFTFTTIVDTAERWFTLELIEDGAGGWSPTWPASVVWLGGAAPTHTTTAGTTTIYAFYTRNGGTTWFGLQLTNGATASQSRTFAFFGG